MESVSVSVCVPVQGSSWGDGLWQVVHQRSPAAPVHRHGQRLRPVALQHADQPAGIGRERLVCQRGNKLPVRPGSVTSEHTDPD